jgi:hypothetical protein
MAEVFRMDDYRDGAPSQADSVDTGGGGPPPSSRMTVTFTGEALDAIRTEAEAAGISDYEFVREAIAMRVETSKLERQGYEGPSFRQAARSRSEKIADSLGLFSGRAITLGHNKSSSPEQPN